MILLHFVSNRIQETTRSILRDETSSIFRELLAAQKNDINALLRQSLTPKPSTNRTTTPIPTATAPAAVASSNVTITSSISDAKQQHVLKLIRLGQLNQAFEFVLSASDLNLVLYLCENIRSTELFSIQPCPLQTPVLLSLIQQLAADLNTHQELKYR
jgi:enhancer of mRNA-decapping protein 4